MDTFTTDATGCVTLPEPLEPGTYYIREMKAVKPYLLDKHKKPISQEVWHPNHAVMDTFTTDATGCVTLPEPLEPGTYYIREMKAVKPYLINGDEIEFDIADDAETQPLTVVRISDERATGSASIVKRCADDSCPWREEGNAIEGARFIVVAMEDILNPSGSVDMPKGTTVELDPTDESGVARIDGLPLGSGTARYAFVEAEAAPGHILDPTPIPFTLSVKRCADDACPWCEEGNAIEGARFIVVAMEDIVNPSGSVDMPKGATVELDPTDESGVARIDGLPLGSGTARYAFVEAEAAPGHILDPTPIPFTLSWVNAETPVVDIEVTHQNAPAETVIHKTDASTGSAPGRSIVRCLASTTRIQTAG